MNGSDMTSREIITRIINRKDAPRIGFDFLSPHPCDFTCVGVAGFVNDYSRYDSWGTYPELLAKVPGFKGTVRMDAVGNILGRLENKTKGECVKGRLTDDWEALETFEFPDFDPDAVKKLQAMGLKDCDKFVLAAPPVAVFSTLRDTRLMDNALTDIILEPEYVRAFLAKVQEVLLKSVSLAYEIGADALFFCDDWGMQHAPFISPQQFRQLFKPVYKAVGDALHERNMKFFLHSCGLVWDFIPDFIDAGIDVLQFDQPELSGSENFARTFGRQAVLYSPVDIQKIMVTGSRELIEESARNMIRVFREYADGALIAKDYPSWEDIDVRPEWADWARNIFLKEGWK